MKYLIMGLLIFGGEALAEVSGSIGLSSQYVFRGVTQTEEDPALQVSLTAKSAAGLYGTFWASTLKGVEASTEANYLVGFAPKLTDSLSVDFGYLQYDYYGDAVELSDEAQELYFGASYGMFSAYVYHDLETQAEYYVGSVSRKIADFDVTAFAGTDHSGVGIARSFEHFSLGYKFDTGVAEETHVVELSYNF